MSPEFSFLPPLGSRVCQTCSPVSARMHMSTPWSVMPYTYSPSKYGVLKTDPPFAISGTGPA